MSGKRWIEIVGLLVFFLCVSISPAKKASGAYDPPVGIPAPLFGINEVAPATATYCPGWPTAANGGSDNCYYIDSTSSLATDTANPFGYPNKPRMTIPTTYAAGSYVEIHGGPYTGGTLQLTVPGTAAKPIWIRGADNGANIPVIRREIVPDGAYTIFENLKTDTVTTAFIQFRVRDAITSSHHMAARYNIAAGPRTSSPANSTFGVEGNATHQMHNIVFYKNTISGYGDFGTILSVEQDWHAIAPTQYCDNIWILNNTAYDVTGDGTQVGVATLPLAASVPHHIYVGGNTFYNNGENCVDVKRSQHVIVSSNLGYGFKYSNHDPGGGIVAHNNADNIWIINNVIHDAAYGFNSSGATGIRIIGNLFYDIHHDSNAGTWNPNSVYTDGAGIQIYASGATEIVNNTIWSSDIGIQTDSGTSYNVTNNIIGNRTQPLGSDIAFGSSAVATASILDNNLFFNGGNVTIKWGDGTSRNIGGIKLTFGKCMSCLEGDPGFVSASTQNFQLTTSSPAINKGRLPLALFQSFQNLYGLDIRKDMAGRNWPLAGPTDLGAFRYPALRPLYPGNISIH